MNPVFDPFFLTISLLLQFGRYLTNSGDQTASARPGEAEGEDGEEAKGGDAWSSESEEEASAWMGSAASFDLSALTSKNGMLVSQFGVDEQQALDYSFYEGEVRTLVTAEPSE